MPSRKCTFRNPYKWGWTDELQENTLRLPQDLNMFSTLSQPATAPIHLPPTRPEAPAEVVFIRNHCGLHRVELGDICSVAADGNYVELQCGQRRFVLRMSLRLLINMLGAAFVQVNRSTAVNVQFLERVDSDTVTVQGCLHSLGRNYRDALMAAIIVLG